MKKFINYARAAATTMLLVLLLVATQTAWAQEQQEQQEQQEHHIKTPADLVQLATDVNSGIDYAGETFYLDNDLDMTDVFFVSIGKSDGTPFRGTFDGGEHTIKGISINGLDSKRQSYYYGGIFGFCDKSTIKNVTLDNSTIAGSTLWYSGIVGNGNGNTTVENCHVTADVSFSGGRTGGIVGQGANIYGCTSAASVNGSTRAGGIGGEYAIDSKCTISNCLYLGTSISGPYPGSIVSITYWGVTLSNNFYTHYGLGAIGNGNNRNNYDVDGQAQLALTSDTKPDKIGDEVKTYGESGITVYEHGLYYKGLYYYAPDPYLFINNATITDIESSYPQSDDNTAISLKYTLTDAAGNTLTEGTDYTAEIKQGGSVVTEVKDYGKYTITFTGNAPYIGSKSVSFTVYKPLNGEGTKDKPFIIANMDDWNTFADYVNSGTETYKDKFIKLTTDLDNVTTMVGTKDNMFQGTFDGDGHKLTVSLTANGDYTAPFRYVNGVSISYLHTEGTINAGNTKYATGLIGEANGKVTIKNCWSSVSISGDMSNKGDKDATHGGFVGVQPSANDNSITITNCLFDGSIAVKNAIKCAGFVGWRNKTLVFYNCLMTGTLDINPTTDSYVFNRNGGSTLNDCYYNKNYDKINKQGDFTTATGEDLRKLLGTAWEVTKDKNGNEIVVPIMNKLSGSGKEDDPYIIRTTDDLDLLAANVNAGNSYEGKYIELGYDIKYQYQTQWNDANSTEDNFTAIGKDNEHPFKGIFDGKGYTISGIRINKPSGYYQGLFGCIDASAKVQNVTLTDARIVGDSYIGGIAGNSYNENAEISNCIIDGKVAIYGKRYVGGMLGDSYCQLSSNLAIGVQIYTNDDHYGVFTAILPWNVISDLLHNNFYYNCTINVKGSLKSSNIGLFNSDRSENNGAMPALVINSDETVEFEESREHMAVIYNRQFVADGGAYTIMLPFGFDASSVKGTFHTLQSVTKDENDPTIGIAKMSNAIDKVEANTPYIFMPSEDFSQIIFKDVDLAATTSAKLINNCENTKWQLHGVYNTKTWTDDDQNEYGFAAAASDDGVSVGEFVHFVSGATLKPTRCYLEYSNKGFAKSSVQLPERIIVVFPDEEVPTTGDITTPVAKITPDSGIKVWSFDGKVFIEAQPDMDYTIVDLSGRTLKNGVTHSTREEVTLSHRAAGIIIVKINGKTFKINY